MGDILLKGPNLHFKLKINGWYLTYCFNINKNTEDILKESESKIITKNTLENIIGIGIDKINLLEIITADTFKYHQVNINFPSPPTVIPYTRII